MTPDDDDDVSAVTAVRSGVAMRTSSIGTDSDDSRTHQVRLTMRWHVAADAADGRAPPRRRDQMVTPSRDRTARNRRGARPGGDVTDTRAVRARTRGARPADAGAAPVTRCMSMLLPVDRSSGRPTSAELDVATDLLAQGQGCGAGRAHPAGRRCTGQRAGARARTGPARQARRGVVRRTRATSPNRCAACPAAIWWSRRRSCRPIRSCWSAWMSVRWNDWVRWPGCWTPAGRAW